MCVCVCVCVCVSVCVCVFVPVNEGDRGEILHVGFRLSIHKDNMTGLAQHSSLYNSIVQCMLSSAAWHDLHREGT